MPGPDFPTGGIILGRSGIRSAYQTGHGSVIMRAQDTYRGDPARTAQAIIVNEIPYQVNKSRLIERIAEVVQRKDASRASPTCATNPTATACAW